VEIAQEIKNKLDKGGVYPLLTLCLSLYTTQVNYRSALQLSLAAPESVPIPSFCLWGFLYRFTYSHKHKHKALTGAWAWLMSGKRNWSGPRLNQCKQKVVLI